MIKYYYSKREGAGGYLYKKENDIFYELEYGGDLCIFKSNIKLPDDLIKTSAQKYLKMSLYLYGDDPHPDHTKYHDAIRKIIKNDFYDEVLKENK